MVGWTANHRGLILSIVIGLGAALRVFYATGVPLSGDESVGLLQATGQATGYRQRLPHSAVAVSEIKKFVSYSGDFSAKDVLSSLRYAGMHPPLYYLGLHYVLKYLGNEPMVLRGVSIVFSLLSVVLVYRLGRAVYGETAGLYGALLLAVSMYGVMYGVMVRPYPLAMFLSLLSSLQAYELITAGPVSLGRGKLWLYAATVSAGLYTIYHFVFVFLFQLVLLAAAKPRDKKALSVVAVVAAVVAAAYLAWIPSLLDQLKVIAAGEYYFHGKSSLLYFADYIVRINFGRQAGSGLWTAAMAVMATAVYATVSAGCWFSLRDKNQRLFVFSLAVYLVFYWLADRLLGMQTLTVGKLHFFVIPAMFILLSAGLQHFTGRYRIRTICLTVCAGLLLAKSAAAGYLKPEFDGPTYVRPFSNSINGHLKQNPKALVIVTTGQRRHLLSLAHAITGLVDVRIIRANDVQSQLNAGLGLKDYDFVFFVNCCAEDEKQSWLLPQNIQAVTDYLVSCGFMPSAPADKVGEGSLYIFAKASADKIKA
jgi:uncharacterized membrane protein